MRFSTNYIFKCFQSSRWCFCLVFLIHFNSILFVGLLKPFKVLIILLTKAVLNTLSSVMCVN